MATFEVVITPRARRDLRAIGEYIKRDDPVAANRFVDRLFKEARRLAHDSSTGSQVAERPHLQRILVTPYHVYYRVDERGVVLVLRFWHTARDLGGMKES